MGKIGFLRNVCLCGTLLCLYVRCKQPGTAESAGNTTSSEGSGADEQSATSAPTATGASTSVVATSADLSSGFQDSSSSSGVLSSDLPEDGCNIWSDDCRVGSKCVPYTETDFLDNTHCVPLPDNPKQSGEPCQLAGQPDSPTDDCDRGLVCWYLDEDQGGICIDRCTGKSDIPSCPSGNERCLTMNQAGTLNVCIMVCDPIAPVCPLGANCYVEPGVLDNFFCTDAPNPVQSVDGAPCLFDGACTAGLLCVSAVHVPDCMSNLCCTKFCDLDLAGGCSNNAQTCVPWPGPPDWMSSPENEDVGFCSSAK